MASNKENILPYNLEAEQSILGCILIDPVNQFEIASKLKTEDFYVPSNKLVFDSIVDVLGLASTPVDFVTLTDKMDKSFQSDNKKKKQEVDLVKIIQKLEEKTYLDQVGGIDYITTLSSIVPSSANWEYYLDIVKRDSIARKIIIACNEIIVKANRSDMKDDIVNFAESKIYNISESIDKSALTNVSENVSGVIDMFENIKKDKNYNQGLMTGYTYLDKYTFGLHKGNLIILAARPAVGKTTWAMNIVQSCAMKYHATVAFFALEMTKDELAQRILCSVARVDNQKAKEGKLEKKDFMKLWEAREEISKAKIMIDDTSMTTVPDILSKCRRIKANGKLDLVVVDHMQLMNAVKKSDSRQSEITEISRGLKMIAKELEVPVIALSQLNRDSAKTNRKPSLTDLRESGSIEQDADIVLFIHRPEVVANNDSKGNSQSTGRAVLSDEAEIIISKNRHGPQKSFPLKFIGAENRFENEYNDDETNLPGYTGNEKGADLNNHYKETPSEGMQQIDDIPFNIDDKDIPVDSIDDEI